MKVGLSLKDYYELDGTDNKFGYVDAGVLFTVPFTRVPTNFGSWNVHGGVSFLGFGDTTKALNNGDAGQVVVDQHRAVAVPPVECQSGAAGDPRYVHVVPGARTAAQQSFAGGNEAMHLDGDLQRSFRQVAAGERALVLLRAVLEAFGELLQPLCIRLRQGQAQDAAPVLHHQRDGLQVQPLDEGNHHVAMKMKAVDRIIVLQKGKVAEEGSHQDLIQKQGLYARLHELQFSKDRG